MSKRTAIVSLFGPESWRDEIGQYLSDFQSSNLNVNVNSSEELILENLPDSSDVAKLDFVFFCVEELDEGLLEWFSSLKSNFSFPPRNIFIQIGSSDLNLPIEFTTISGALSKETTETKIAFKNYILITSNFDSALTNEDESLTDTSMVIEKHDLVSSSKRIICEELVLIGEIEKDLRNEHNDKWKEFWNESNNWDFNKYKTHLTTINTLLSDAEEQFQHPHSQRKFNEVPALLLLAQYTRFLVANRVRKTEPVVNQPSLVPKFIKPFETNIPHSFLLAAFIKILFDFQAVSPVCESDEKTMVVTATINGTEYLEDDDVQLFTNAKMPINCDKENNIIELKIPAT